MLLVLISLCYIKNLFDEVYSGIDINEGQKILHFIHFHGYQIVDSKFYFYNFPSLSLVLLLTLDLPLETFLSLLEPAV